MTITIKLSDQLARELLTIVQVRIMDLHVQHERTLQRKDGNQHALLKIIQQQRSDAYDLHQDINRAVREASPSIEII